MQIFYFLTRITNTVYGKGKEDSDEWDNSAFGEIIDSSIDAEIKSEPYDTMYNEEENYSENSNID